MNELFFIEWQDEDFWLNKEVSACLCGVKEVDVHMRVKNGQIKERSDEMVTLGQGSGKWDVKSCSDQNGRFVLRSAFIWSLGGIETRVSTGLEFELLRMLCSAGHKEKPESYGGYLYVKMYPINKIGRKWNI